MKHLTALIIAGFFALLIFPANAQIFGNDPEIKIDNMAPESVWQIAEMAMNENSIPIGKLNLAEGVLMSNWIEWTAIAIQNHAHLYLKYEAPTLTIKIADREYKSDKGYSEAIGSLSKKKYAEYVQSTADRITEISKDEALTGKAVKTSKLIPAFSAVHLVGDLEWKLISLVQTDKLRPNFVFEVTNKSNKPLKIKTHAADFLRGKTGVERGYVKWDKPDDADYKGTTIGPGETVKGFFSTGAGYKVPTTQGYVLLVKYDENGDLKNQKEFKVYSIPMPYEYREGD